MQVLKNKINLPQVHKLVASVVLYFLQKTCKRKKCLHAQKWATLWALNGKGHINYWRTNTWHQFAMENKVSGVIQHPTMKTNIESLFAPKTGEDGIWDRQGVREMVRRHKGGCKEEGKKKGDEAPHTHMPWQISLNTELHRQRHHILKYSIDKCITYRYHATTLCWCDVAHDMDPHWQISSVPVYYTYMDTCKIVEGAVLVLQKFGLVQFGGFSWTGLLVQVLIGLVWVQGGPRHQTRPQRRNTVCLAYVVKKVVHSFLIVCHKSKLLGYKFENNLYDSIYY